MIPSLVKFGTSTWTYEGWKGDVYKKTYRKGRFKQDCIAEYAAYEYQGERLFRIVGFDFTFYGPPTARQLQHYASLVPHDFQACAKVWEEIAVRGDLTALERSAEPRGAWPCGGLLHSIRS